MRVAGTEPRVTPTLGQNKSIDMLTPTSGGKLLAAIAEAERGETPSASHVLSRFAGPKRFLLTVLFASQWTVVIMADMESAKYFYWQDKDQWLGYLQDYPDYWTQGESREELQASLRDLYVDLTSGEIPGVRKLAELTLR